MVVQLKFGTYFWYVERVNLDKIMVVQIKFGTYFWYVY